MAVLKPAAAGLCVLVFTSCERAPDPFELARGIVGVHAIFEAGSSVARVLLTMNTAGGEVEALPEAQVELRRGEEQWILTPGGSCVSQPAGACYEASLAVPFRSGDSILLNVVLPGGAKVTGEAIVAEPPTIVGPLPDESFVPTCAIRNECGPQSEPVLSIQVAVEASAALGRVEPILRQNTAFAADTVVQTACELRLRTQPRIILDFAVSTVIHVEQISCSPVGLGELDSLHVYVVALGYDTVYARYLTDVENGTQSPAHPTLNGAMGVVAGAAADSVLIALTDLRDAAVP